MFEEHGDRMQPHALNEGSWKQCVVKIPEAFKGWVHFFFFNTALKSSGIVPCMPGF